MPGPLYCPDRYWMMKVLGSRAASIMYGTNSGIRKMEGFLLATTIYGCHNRSARHDHQEATKVHAMGLHPLGKTSDRLPFDPEAARRTLLYILVRQPHRNTRKSTVPHASDCTTSGGGISLSDNECLSIASTAIGDDIRSEDELATNSGTETMPSSSFLQQRPTAFANPSFMRSPEPADVPLPFGLERASSSRL